MSEENKKDTTLEKEHQKEYMTQLYEDSNIEDFFKKSIENVVTSKKAEEYEIPEVNEINDEEQENIVDKPEGTPVNMTNDTNSDDKELLTKINKIISDIGDVNLQVQLNNVKKEINNEIEPVLKSLQKELDELKDRKVPKRKYYDSGGIYKEELFNTVTKVLDTILIDLFEELPDYHMIQNQITNVYDDGTVENGLSVIGVTVSKDGYRYDFKVDVPILNGIINTPLYIQRGLKIIPLTEEAIYSELESLAFRKVDIEDTTARKNTFNNIGDNPTRRPDNQKAYEVKEKYPNSSSVPEKSKWNPVRDKGY